MQTKITKVLKLLYVQVLIGLALGILVGFLFPDFGASLKVLGRPVRQGREDDDRADRVLHDRHRHHVARPTNKKIGKTLGKSLGLFYVLTILSLLIGLATVLLIKPGQGMHIDPTHLDPVGGRQRNQGRAAGHLRRVHPAHRPGHLLRRLRRGSRAAGAVPGDPVRLRPQQRSAGPDRRC